MVYANWRKETLFTPLRIYLLSLAATLGIASLRMNPAMTPFHTLTWVVLIGSSVTFGVGCLIAGLGQPLVVRPLDIGRFRDRPVILLLLTLFGLLVLASMQSLNAFGSWPLFAKSPEEARAVFVFYSTWGMWSYGHETVLLTLAPALVFFSRTNWIRVGAMVVFVAAFVIQMLIAIRNPFLLSVFVWLALWDLGVRRLKIRAILLATFGFFSLFTVIAFMRAKVIKSIFSSTEEGSPLYRMFLPIYNYVANNYWNLDNSLAKWGHVAEPNYQYGMGFLFRGLLQPFMSYPMPNNLGWKSLSYEKVSSLNTHTYHWYLWQDGGIFLVLLFPFVWGWASTMLYRKAVGSGNPMLLYLYAYTLFPVAFTFFAFYFSIGSYTIPILWIAFLIPFGAGSTLFGATNRR